MHERALAPPGLIGVEALCVRAGTAKAGPEWLADEVPVALSYNGISHAVMLASPTDLEDFALGFSLTEGLITQAHELLDIQIHAHAEGVEVAMTLLASRMAAMRGQQRRQLAGRTGCGLCGVDSLETAMRPIQPVAATDFRLRPAQIEQALSALAAHQPLNQASGAVHAAALMCGESMIVREDLGRHNALDKAIGAMLSARQRADWLLMTSRASYEIVHKAAAAGVPLVAAISAPTALAVSLAETAGITLIGFARETRFTIYSHPWRIET